MDINFFDKQIIYDLLFLSSKSVLIHKNIEELKLNSNLYDSFINTLKYKFNIDINKSYDEAIKTYNEKFIYYPEYCKIIGISTARIYIDNGEIKRKFTSFYNDDEKILLDNFMELMTAISNDAVKSTPINFPKICGYNINIYDIPLIIKRFIYLNIDNNSELPKIFKNLLKSKPWSDTTVDISNGWSFNGYSNIDLNTISTFLNLKKTVKLMTNEEINTYYWNNINENHDETINFLKLQIATQVNMYIQFINLLRKF